MTSEQAKSYLTLHAQPATDPVLTDAEQTALVLQAKCEDSEGRGISDAGYVETYDIPSMLYNAWMVKAAKASSSYAISDSGLSLHREQVHAQCLKQAEYWKSQIACSISGFGASEATWKQSDDGLTAEERLEYRDAVDRADEIQYQDKTANLPG